MRRTLRPAPPERGATLAGRVQSLARPLAGPDDLDPLLERIGDAPYVLLGEASHGTSEYYLWRARLSRRLIAECGFRFIAVEGDWPDCYRVNRYLKGYDGGGANAFEVLHAFERWPTWMWANWEIVALAEWLRGYNRDHDADVGFYGLDVYSLWESLEAILRYLEREHPGAAEAARTAFLCFEPFKDDAHSYAFSTLLGPTNCEDAVVRVLSELRGATELYAEDPEGAFNAEQNAHAMVGAEHYYRTMVRGSARSWNVRDTHMADTLDRLIAHHGEGAKAIVWAHNTHVGDATATDMADEGMVNLGQLVRERHGRDQAVLVGFASHRGEVIAGRAWDAPMEALTVPPGTSTIWEALLHTALGGDRLLLLGGADEERELVAERGHRAIGVVYHPEREWGNYVPTRLPLRYDALLYLDETHALHPLHLEPEHTGEPPETYPFGL